MANKTVATVIMQLRQQGLHPSRLLATAISPETWQVTIALADWYTGGGGDLPHHSVRVDRRDMPGGVSVSQSSRWPDEVVIIRASWRDLLIGLAMREHTWHGQDRVKACLPLEYWIG